MRTQHSAALRNLALISTLVLGVAGCGSSTQNATTSQSQQPLGATTAGDRASGYPLPDCTGQSPASCAFNGFDPLVDGFGFENWGAPGNIGATEMIALFGRKKVCASGAESQCVLFPAARQWAAQVNEAMAGGHCEGMAVLAERLFLGQTRLAALDPAADSVFELARETPPVAKAIDLWWATQMLPPVQTAYEEFQTYQPSEIAAALADGLTRRVGYTMGIYSEAGGHAITPIGVSAIGNKIAVSAYDNNFPGSVQRIMIDPKKETWSYAMGSTNPNAPTGGWEGGQGTIDLTPMQSRTLPVAAPFADGVGKGATGTKTSQLLVSSPDPSARLGLKLTIDGHTYDTSDPRVRLPQGVTARTALGSVLSGKGVSVTVDRSRIRTFAATLATIGDSTATTPVTMSIDDPSSPRITLRGTVDQGAGLRPGFGVSRNGRITVKSANIDDAKVNVSNGLNSADFTLPDGIDMRVGARDGNGATDIEYIDEDGHSAGTYELSFDSEDGSVTDIVADFNADSGDFDITMSDAAAEDVDIELLTAWEDISAQDAAADGKRTADQASSGDAGDDAVPGTGDNGSDQAPADDQPANDGAGDSSTTVHDSTANDTSGSGDAAANDQPAAQDPPAEDAPAGE